MTDIELKTLALVNEVLDDLGHAPMDNFLRSIGFVNETLCRIIEQHEATKKEFSNFRQEVSRVMTYIKALYPTLPTDYDRFIIPASKPDPLAEVIKEWWNMDIRENDAETLRELLEARGLEIRSKNDDPAPIPTR